MDVQGAEVARPYVEKAGAEYTTLIDSDNLLAAQFGFKFVPLILLFDEHGVLIEGPRPADVGDVRLVTETEDWIERGPASVLGKIAARSPRRTAQPGFASEEAKEHFLNASRFIKKGLKTEALAELNRAFALDPDNWLIRKQRWVLEHPEKFYQGDIDFGWQKQMISQNK